MIEQIRTELSVLKKNNLYRIRNQFDQTHLNFSENDYLGFRSNKKLITYAKKALSILGLGSGASPLVYGHHQAHANIEDKISKIIGLEAGILFNSGFVANLTFFKTIANENIEVYMDKSCHTSMYEGVRISGAKLIRYPHLDTAILENKLKKSSKSKTKIIVTDALFSMDGDYADVNNLIKLSKKYNTYLYIDEAHSFGICGEKGEGLLSDCIKKLTKTEKRKLISLTTFGKAAGFYGSVLSCSNEIKDLLIQKSKEYIYSTNMPEFAASILLNNTEALLKAQKKREKLKENIKYFRSGFVNKRMLINSESPIQGIIINDVKKLIKIHDALREKKIIVPVIRTPTVPPSKSRLRIIIRANHTKKEIKRLQRELINLLDDQI